MASKISKAEASQLRELMKEPGWDIVLRILGEDIDTINGEEIGGNNEFETLRSLHRNEGRVQGLKDFFDKLEHGAVD